MKLQFAVYRSIAPMTNQDITIKWANRASPHDEAYRLILRRSYDMKMQKTGHFGAKYTIFIPFAWKYPQAILRASCRKAGCAFLLQREFSPLAVRFWEPIASLDRQNRSNFRRKIPARETYSPPPFIIDSRKILKWKKVFPMSIIITPWTCIRCSTTAQSSGDCSTPRSTRARSKPTLFWLHCIQWAVQTLAADVHLIFRYRLPCGWNRRSALGRLWF